jgi:hypothetical protein
VLDKSGYRQHPETVRWAGKLAALYLRHELLVGEMERRGYRHASPLDAAFATGSARQDVFIDPPEEQLRLLRVKPCECLLGVAAEEDAADPVGPSLPGSSISGSHETLRSAARFPIEGGRSDSPSG